MRGVKVTPLVKFVLLTGGEAANHTHLDSPTAYLRQCMLIYRFHVFGSLL